MLLLWRLWSGLRPGRIFGYKYHILNIESESFEGTPADASWATRHWRGLRIAAAALLLGMLVYAVTILGNYCGLGQPQAGEVCDTPEHGYQCSPSISHYWGQYSPYYAVKSEIDNATPPGCELTFVQALSRHGARDPTASKTAVYAATVNRIQDAVTSFGKGFEFLRSYRYRLGADQLSYFGQQELELSATHFYERYKALARASTPVLRSSGQQRVLESAKHWRKGFGRSCWLDQRCPGPSDFNWSIITIEEADGVNNTLSHSLCPAFENGTYANFGREAGEKYMDVFMPSITTRLNANLPGANLSKLEASYMMDLCAFETVADKEGRLSPFCSLFSEAEWQQYDYYQSVSKWYGIGDGNPLGPTQGVGWVNELIARLMGRPVADHTSTNKTLDASPETFPLNRPLYADFSHDNDMVAIYAALGLFRGARPPSNTTLQTPAQMAGYSASRTVPFAARMYVERMSCSGEAEELVRILVNDRVVPLQDCGADALGRCRLSSFVDSLGFARRGGRWNECFP